VVRKITAQVINCNIVTSSEVQEQVEVGDEVPMISSPSRNVQPENIHRNGKSLNYYIYLRDLSGSGKLAVESTESPFMIITQFTNDTRYCVKKSSSDSKHYFHILYNMLDVYS